MRQPSFTRFTGWVILFGLCLPMPGAQLTRGPYLQLGTPTSIIVRWRTLEATDSQVLCGINRDSLSLEVRDEALTTEHMVLVADLQPDTRYFYSVGSSDEVFASGPELFFVTAPLYGKPTRILVTSDMQWNRHNVAPAYQAFTRDRHTDLWLTAGDTGGDSDEDFQQNLFEVYAGILSQTVIWPCMGNHDAAAEPLFSDVFTLPTQGEAGGVPSGTESYYSFNYGNIHCVVLNSVIEDRTTNGPMYAWLEQDLVANTRDWLIAYWHYPPYTKGVYDSDALDQLKEMRRHFLPLLEAQGVDLVLSGHNHIYERSFQIDSHYGLSTSLDPQSMFKNGGDGRWEGSGPYCKPSLGPNPHQGTVYVKVPSAYNYPLGMLHPAMFTAQQAIGCLVFDIDGPVLEARFLRDDGQIGDSFTLIKGIKAVPPRLSGIRADSGQIQLTWNAIPWRCYRVFRSAGLGLEWMPASPWLLATERTMLWAETGAPSSPLGFYRIQISTE